MRISDWSSDVCSSDLPAHGCKFARAARALQRREDAVRVIGDRDHARPLDAQMALGNGVRPVGSDLDAHPVPDFRHEAALRLAKPAIGDVGAVRSLSQTTTHPPPSLFPGPFNPN